MPPVAGRGTVRGGGGSTQVNPSPGTSYQEKQQTGRASLIPSCGVQGKTGPADVNAVIPDVTSLSTLNDILTLASKGRPFTKQTPAGLLTVTLQNLKDFARDDLQKYLRAMLNKMRISCGNNGGVQTKDLVSPAGAAGKLTVQLQRAF
ncbi:unnamed protein product [Calypogeia fissa]